MSKPIAHRTYPAHITVDLGDETIELAAFDLDIPIHAKVGETITDADGDKHVVINIAPIEPDEIQKALKRALRRRTVTAVPEAAAYNHVRAGFAH